MQRLNLDLKRQDYRFGVLAASVVNTMVSLAVATHRGKGQRRSPKPKLPGDFYPSLQDLQPAARSVTVKPWQQQLQMVEALNAFFGGTDTRSDEDRVAAYELSRSA